MHHAAHACGYLQIFGQCMYYVSYMCVYIYIKRERERDYNAQ